MRLFTDEGSAPVEEDVAEVILSSLVVRRPRQFGDCWVGCKLWEELGLRQFWQEALGEKRGEVPWHKVVELLAINRLCAPRSELFIHEKWFGQTAMDVLLDSDSAVAEKDRLYRCLDRMVEHKGALEKHLFKKWQDLFGTKFEVLLYDLTSTYFEGEAMGVPQARRGYSRDHRPDCKQIILAVVVTPEGFPLSYEVFDGNRVDVTTLKEVLESVEKKYGRAQRIWVFDRGIVSEENLETLQKHGGHYIVGTARHQLQVHQQKLLDGAWQKISDSVEVQLLTEGKETYVLAKSTERAEKEKAMRNRLLKGLTNELVGLRRSIRNAKLCDPEKIKHRLGRLHERYRQAWKYVAVDFRDGKLSWQWDRAQVRLAVRRDGAYMLRTNLDEKDPQKLWQMYVQLTEVEAVFRSLKSDLAIRPIRHWVQKRVEAHGMVAFLGYCLWVCLKHKLKVVAQGLTPWQLLDQFQRIVAVEVWFKLRKGGVICLPRITQPEEAQAAILDQLSWQLPQQPPPKIYKDQVPNVWTT